MLDPAAKGRSSRERMLELKTISNLRAMERII